MYYRDVRYALPLVIQLWMFATPIVYPLSLVPERWQFWYILLNPMASVIDGYRRAVLRGLPPDLPALGLAAVVSVVLFVFCYRGFKRMEGAFADVV